MQHVDSLLVFDPNVGSILYKELNEFDIPVETCEVKRIETFIRL